MPGPRCKLIGKACAVVICRNCDGDIRLGNSSVFQVHAPLLHRGFPCVRPFSTRRIPQGEKNKLTRQCWLLNLQRDNFDPGTSTRNVPCKERRQVMRHHTTQSQLWPGGLSTDNSPQHSTAHEPNEVFSVELSGDDTNDSLPARNRLRPGNVIYEQAFRVYKSALVPTKCLSCDCSCKGIRKMDKVVPAQPEEDYNTYHANVQVLVKQEIFQQLGVSQTDLTV
nr:uncharacterized protein LOC119172454 [Rhipicephalus microplus]